MELFFFLIGSYKWACETFFTRFSLQEALCCAVTLDKIFKILWKCLKFSFNAKKYLKIPKIYLYLAKTIL